MTITCVFESLDEFKDFVNKSAVIRKDEIPAYPVASPISGEEVKESGMATDVPVTEPAKETPVTPKPVTEEKPIDMDELVRQFIGLKNKAGKETVRSVLTDLGVNKVSEIPPENFEKAAELVGKAMEAAGGEEDA